MNLTYKNDHELEGELIGVRRNLHREPELAYEEFRTTEKLRAWLTAAHIHILDLPLATGLIAEVGQGDGPIVAIRCDIDALPIEEQTGLPYASEIPGKMHACGHDFHTAVILGAALLLKAREHELPGRVRILFQPAEETGHGAESVLESGGLKDVAAIFGLHNSPELPTGTFGTRSGPLTAGVDRFEIKVKGVGAHAATPEKGVDTIVTAAQIITMLQTVVSRQSSAIEPVVLSVTRINGGFTWNVIPELVELEGTVRTYNEEIRREIPLQMTRIIEGIAGAAGAEAKLLWYPGPPATVNHAEWADFTKQAASDAGYKVEDIPLQMGGEDFALYLQQIPGAFVNIGAGPGYALHHPQFDVDEAAILPAAKYFAALAEQALQKLQA
ncbi:hydrolase [Paenibacillus sp. FSL R7-0273]|uniref:amidohydrolase n=1 Tax=Paenibacillus sp. FSL R7-0273 TaxID=1536772 RepID=UPI0004F610E3|nr:amidohydrolase [Paenibacillus sp. FSL R7-0273]AIQ47961.1 hydrolase [Paenibacillus sp. FSL R7-0273]OMF94487.1 hydrolase [Paenibacillus sp. FSL R7-0273]